MRKATVLLFAIIVLVTSALAVNNPGSQLTLFMSSSQTLAMLRLYLVLLVLLIGFLATERGALVRYLSAVVSVGLLMTGLLCLFSPTLLGHMSFFVMPFDTLILIEAGVLSGISALQPQTKFANETHTLTRSVPALSGWHLPKPVIQWRPVHAFKAQQSLNH